MSTSNSDAPVSDKLSQAAALLRARDQEAAQVLLADFIKENPDSEKGWWLLSFAVSDPSQQISCLKRVLRLNPNHTKARERLDLLTGEKPPPTPQKQTSRPPVQKKKSTLGAKEIIFTVGLLLIVCSVMGYFGYRILTTPQTKMPEQVAVVQEPIISLTSTSKLPPTWTDTPVVTRTPTRTAVPLKTEAPASGAMPTATHTPDPNASPVPISESLKGPGIGQHAPDFTLVNAGTSEETSLSDYADHPVLLIFMTTWCTYCAKEMPDVQAVYEKYRDQGFVVLGVGVGASQSALRNYAHRFGLTFPLLSDWQHTIAEEYGIGAYPTNYVIRKSGRTWQINVGMMSEGGLEDAVNYVLAAP